MEPDSSLPHSQVSLLPLSRARLVHSMTPTTFWRYVLMWTIYTQVFQVVSFPQLSPPKPCVHRYSPPYMLHFHPSSSSCFDHPINIWWGIQIMEILIMQSFPLSCYLVPLRDKRLPPHPTRISKHTSSYVRSWIWATEFHTHTKQQAKL